MEITEALDIIERLSRTKNYPRDINGLNFLAEGLTRAAGSTGVDPSRIVKACAAASEWCPTDADLLSVARDIARLDAVAAGTYDTTAGGSNSAGRHRPPCARCQNSGWEIVWTLHTLGPDNNWRHAKRENVTQDQAVDLISKIDGRRQQVYSGARRCLACSGGLTASADWAKQAAGDRDAG